MLVRDHGQYNFRWKTGAASCSIAIEEDNDITGEEQGSGETENCYEFVYPIKYTTEDGATIFVFDEEAQEELEEEDKKLMILVLSN